MTARQIDAAIKRWFRWLTSRPILCKFPRLLGGGHRWRRLTKKEMAEYNMKLQRLGAFNPIKILQSPRTRICRRCSAEHIAKQRKTKQE